MASNNKDKRNKNLLGNRTIKNNLALLNKSLTDLYQDTYYSSRTDLDDSVSIRSDIERSVETIMHNNLDNSSVGNISRMYAKMRATSKDNQNLLDAIKELNDDTLTQTVLSSWVQNKWIKDLNAEIDMVLKYAPKLREALLCKKDCVLSADHFSKEFLNFTNLLSSEKEDLFNRRMEELKEKYQLPEKIEQWYDDAQTYGEQYIYIVPYKTEFERLLKKKASPLNMQSGYNTEQTISITEASVVHSNSPESKVIDNFNEASACLTEGAYEYAKEKGLDNVKVSINMSGLLESSVEGLKRANALNEAGLYQTGIGKFFNETYINEAKNEPPKNKDVGSKTKLAKQLVPDDLEFKDDQEDPASYASDMIIGKELADNRIKINVPGCVVKELTLENVLPQFIEDTCLGYFYIEVEGTDLYFDDPNSFEYAAGLNTVSNSRRLSRNIDQYNMEDKNNLLNYLSGEIYKMIDSKFVNDNQDLRKEIYMILKHNELFNSTTPLQEGHIKVSFLSADDVHPIIFNKDKITHRGKSDLEFSLFPAKLYSCLYITNVLGIITRGQDKRVYYVKQNVETNISKTVLNVINQIKKGNFGARQMENLGNILNITGKFNDIVIPTNSSGDPPINMEILEGQRFTDNSELMSMLEKQMIDPTDVPYDLIESRQSLDYAIQATMSNSKLMRATYKRQDAYEAILSPILTKIYNYEYEENEDIKVTLPAPSFLNATNGQQLVEGTMNYLDSIVNSELADEEDDIKAEFKRLGLRYYIPSHLNLSIIDRLKVEAKINVQKKRRQEEQ